jgi:hypothetical protein
MPPRSGAPDLGEAQRLLWRLIVAPEGVEAGLRELDTEAAASGSAQLAELVRSDARLPAVERLGVYASAYFERLRGVLESDFPGLRAALGEAPFHDLATSYLAVHPPRHFSLRYAGADLPGFLETHAAAAVFRERFAWSADLARLEWALAEVFDAVDGPCARRADLAAVPPERWAQLRLELAPSALLVEVEWAVQPLRRRYERDELTVASAAATPARASSVCVWRHDERVFHRELDAAEAAALQRVAAGVSFGQVCELAEERVGEDQAAATAAGWLASWLDDGLLASAEVGG